MLTGLCVDVRLVGENATRGRGELQFLYDDGEWADVCSGAVGVIDAQIACRTLGFSFYSSIGIVEE